MRAPRSAEDSHPLKSSVHTLYKRLVTCVGGAGEAAGASGDAAGVAAAGVGSGGDGGDGGAVGDDAVTGGG